MLSKVTNLPDYFSEQKHRTDEHEFMSCILTNIRTIYAITCFLADVVSSNVVLNIQIRYKSCHNTIELTCQSFRNEQYSFIGEGSYLTKVIYLLYYAPFWIAHSKIRLSKMYFKERTKLQDSEAYHTQSFVQPQKEATKEISLIVVLGIAILNCTLCICWSSYSRYWRSAIVTC